MGPSLLFLQSRKKEGNGFPISGGPGSTQLSVHQETRDRPRRSEAEFEIRRGVGEKFLRLGWKEDILGKEGLHLLSIVNVSVLNQVLCCNLHQGLVKKERKRCER